VGDAPSADRKELRPRREKSLLSRALGYLARREHSRVELARKLAPYAQSAAEVEALLDALQDKKLLSEARFVEVLARSRGERFGAARVRQELKAHGISDELQRPALNDLRVSELARARALWQRRFGEPATEPSARARQMRFLAGRGFSSEVIRKVVGGHSDD
jgi:regulatory protein